jgi:aromatic-L-amino-acid decarboxylase
MNAEEFRKNGYKTIDWIADYLENIEKYPVKSNVKPGEIFEKFEDKAPNLPDSFDELINDLNQKILPGITFDLTGYFSIFSR